MFRQFNTTIVLGVCAFSPVYDASAESPSRVGLGSFQLSKSPATAPSMSVSYTLSSQVDFDSAAGGISWEQADLSLPLSSLIHLNDSNAVTFGLKYEATWLNTDSPLGNMNLHDLRLNVRWMHQVGNSKWSYTAVVSPGLASDGSGVDSDDFVLSGQAGFRYQKSARFAWIGGIVVLVDPLETRVFPGIGFQWMPNDDVNIRLAGPVLTASWQVHHDWILHADARISGGAWNVEQGGDSFDVSLHSYQAALGIEHRLSEKVWIGLWGGITFANELEIENSAGNQVFKDDADAGWFVRLGIRKVLW